MPKFISRGSNYGKLALLAGVLVGLPLVVLPFYTAEICYAPAFLFPMAFSLVLGLIICARTYHLEEKIYEWQAPWQRASLPVLFVWCYSFIIGAIPFVLAGQLDPLHALFESVSGW